MRIVSRTLAPMVGALLLAMIAPPLQVRGAQIPAGQLSSFKDMEPWSRFIDDLRMTERGVGLIASGGNGAVHLSFSAKLQGRQPSEPPTEVLIHVGRDARANPGRLTPPTMRFVIDELEKNPLAIDLSARAVANTLVPGDVIDDLSAVISLAEFRQFFAAKTIRGDLLGFEVSLRPDQVKALHAFGQAILVPAAATLRGRVSAPTR